MMDQETYGDLLRYLAPEDKAQKVFENQSVLKQPIVRNGKKATVGYQQDAWKTWLEVL